MWFNFRACLISLTLSLVAATSLMSGLGVWPIVGWMAAACIVIGLLRNGKSVDQPGIFIPICALVVGFLLGANGAGPAWQAVAIILVAAAGGYLSGEFEQENTTEFSDRLPTFVKYLGIAVWSLWLGAGSWFDMRPPGMDFLEAHLRTAAERHIVLGAGVYPLVALGAIWAAILILGCTVLAWDWLKNGPSAKK